MNIPIPEIFTVRNRQLIQSDRDGVKKAYLSATAGRGKASDCIGCGQCEAACPQQLPITGLLRAAADALE